MMTEIMIFTHSRLEDLSLTTAIHVNNLCPQVGVWKDEKSGKIPSPKPKA